MSGLHIDGVGPGTNGLRELREFARDLGRQNGVNQVSEVEIEPQEPILVIRLGKLQLE